MGFFSLMVKVYKDPSGGFDSDCNLELRFIDTDYYLPNNLIDLIIY